MIALKTQSAAYWGADFAVTPADVEALYNTLLEAERPLTTDDLALALIDFRVQQERSRLQMEAARGELYQPQDHYRAGQQLVFPALNFQVGTVTNVRPGRNPEHGEFEVIAVQFEGRKKPVEFAAGLQTPHKLNRANGDDVLLQMAGPQLDAQELYQSIAAGVRGKLAGHLRQNAATDFIESDDGWLLKDMLADIHIGYLNIAEAVIEMRGEPVSSADLMKEMELPAEIPDRIKTFSLVRALQSDERFTRVSVGGQTRWTLRRLQPAEAVQVPDVLVYTPPAVTPVKLSADTRQIEWDLDDEWSDLPEENLVFDQNSATWLLTYPHLRAGTLPLNTRIRHLLPLNGDELALLTLIDGQRGRRFNAWAVPQARYVAGLKEWYSANALVAGAALTLTRAGAANEFEISFRPRRRRREWVRVLSANGNRPVVETSKVEIACDYDELLVVGEASPDQTDSLRRALAEAGASVADIVEMLVPELTKLSSQGNAHAKTLYSVFNMLRRMPPAPILAALASSRSFSELGGGYWKMAR